MDQKDTIPTAYEKAFRTILPALLQTKSLRNPMTMLRDGADYRFFEKKYAYAPGDAPTYLREVYGLDYGPPEDVIDVGKLVRDDFQLVDSKDVAGVQVADLLASGLRRTLRGHFDWPEDMAFLLGANMLQQVHRRPPVHLVGLGTDEARVSDRSAHLLKIMTSANRPYLSDANRRH